MLYGTDSDLQLAGFQIIDMIFFGTLDPNDEFGSALATGTFFDTHGGEDLLVGIPGRVHDNGFVNWPDTGAVLVVQSAIFFADGFESGDLSAWSP